MKVAYPTIFTDVGKNILIEVPEPSDVLKVDITKSTS